MKVINFFFIINAIINVLLIICLTYLIKQYYAKDIGTTVIEADEVLLDLIQDNYNKLQEHDYKLQIHEDILSDLEQDKEDQ